MQGRFASSKQRLATCGNPAVAQLKSCHLSHAAEVCLCATGQKSKSGFSVGKRLRFVCTRKKFAEVLRAKFGVCSCSQHAPMNDVDFHETGKYDNALAAGILAAAAAW